MINRAAILLRYKEPALHWILTADESDQVASLSLDDLNKENTVFLISDEDGENSETCRAWISRNFRALFEHALEAWYVDESLWPKDLSLVLFDQWFDVECHSVVIDTLDDPIIDEDLDAEPGPPEHLLN